MKEFFTEEQYERLLFNGTLEQYDDDHWPIAKLFDANSRCIMLVSELYKDYPDRAYGLIDLGWGLPVTSRFNIKNLQELGMLSLDIHRDENFVSKYPLNVYLAAASHARRITEDDVILKRFAKPAM